MRKEPWLGYTPTSKSRRYAALAREGIVHSYTPAGQLGPDAPLPPDAEAEQARSATRSMKRGKYFGLLLLGGIGYLIYKTEL
jgi:hypothetical protein